MGIFPWVETLPSCLWQPLLFSSYQLPVENQSPSQAGEGAAYQVIGSAKGRMAQGAALSVPWVGSSLVKLSGWESGTYVPVSSWAACSLIVMNICTWPLTCPGHDSQAI